MEQNNMLGLYSRPKQLKNISPKLQTVMYILWIYTNHDLFFTLVHLLWFFVILFFLKFDLDIAKDEIIDSM